MPKYEVEYKLVFYGMFDFETDREGYYRAADEYLYDCWYNLIDRPDDMDIVSIGEA